MFFQLTAYLQILSNMCNEKKSMYKCIITVQSYVAQGSNITTFIDTPACGNLSASKLYQKNLVAQT